MAQACPRTMTPRNGASARRSDRFLIGLMEHGEHGEQFLAGHAGLKKMRADQRNHIAPQDDRAFRKGCLAVVSVMPFYPCHSVTPASWPVFCALAWRSSFYQLWLKPLSRICWGPSTSKCSRLLVLSTF